MTTAINDIRSQARQGSVAAIIQILNERLADGGIRTRAMFVDGVLQLLCEAATLDQLEQPIVVGQVQGILEEISPRNITKVNINSRIVQEQQLLWFDEISRDPENNLLWAELISLKKPNLLQRWLEDLKAPKSRLKLPESLGRPPKSPHRWLWRGLIGGASLCLFIVLVGWTTKEWLGLDVSHLFAGVDSTTEPAASPPATPGSKQDPFAQAVRIAEQAAYDGQQVTTVAEWLDLAARWQRASDLMAQVPSDDARFPTAQQRVTAYRQNSEMALQQSERLQSEETQADSPTSSGTNSSETNPEAGNP